MGLAVNDQLLNSPTTFAVSAALPTSAGILKVTLQIGLLFRYCFFIAIAGSSLTKAAIFGRDANWGRIAGAAGRAGVSFDQNQLRIKLGDFLLMEQGQPLSFDGQAAHDYLCLRGQLRCLSLAAGGTNLHSSANSNDLITDDGQSSLRPSMGHSPLEHPVVIALSVGEGPGQGVAWGCDLSYDYVKINAEYTT